MAIRMAWNDLRDHIGDDDDQLTEIIGVGCDARDDAAR